MTRSTLSARAKERASRSRLAPHLALGTCILIWSANATVLKVGLEHVRVVPFTAARFLIGGTVLLALATASARGIPRPPPARAGRPCWESCSTSSRSRAGSRSPPPWTSR